MFVLLYKYLSARGYYYAWIARDLKMLNEHSSLKPSSAALEHNASCDNSGLSATEARVSVPFVFHASNPGIAGAGILVSEECDASRHR